MRQTRLSIVSAAAVLAATLTLDPLGASAPAGLAYAVRGARVFTAAGAPIDNATVVIRDGVIEQVGAGVAAPADAVVIDATGMNVYPGLIDMTNDAPIDTGEAPAAGGGGRGGGGRGAQTQAFANREDAERAKRENILRADFAAAANLRTTPSPELAQLAAAGVTSVLAVPSSGIFKGQSALVNVVVPPDDPQISTVADYRRGLAVVKAPVATHIDMAGRGGGQGYPQSLLGTIAFTRQSLLDAQWQQQAVAQYEKAPRGPRPIVEPPLTALQPVLARELPAAFDAGNAREIDRALAMAAEFNLDPIVVGAQQADMRTADLAKAKARVIFSVALPGGGGGGGGRGGGRGGGGGSPSLRQLKEQAAVPKVPAALLQAGVPFAFTSGNANPAEFVRNVGRIIKDGGLAADAALRALTIDAARLAGAADRLGTIERGKIANLVVTQGDLFGGGSVRHVFIDGHPVDVDVPAPQGGGGRGRGGN